MFWTDEMDQTLFALKADGLSHAEIARALKVSRCAIGGRLYRLRPANSHKRRTLPRQAKHSHKANAALLPSKTPFAPDFTCPDFAWDEDHCAAVLSTAKGGFPVMPQRRAA